MVQSNFIQLHPDDNVLICLRPCRAGETILVNEEKIVLVQQVKLGHKVARCPVSRSNKIVKYGVSIGSATHDIRPGEHVHLHNMKSDYIRPHTRAQL